MKNSLVLSLCLLTACSTGSVVTQPASTTSPTPTTTPIPTATPTSVPVLIPTAPELISLKGLVNGSSCSKYSWKDRGKAPSGYTLGVAETFVKSMCSGRPIMGQSAGEDGKDALAWYGKAGSLVNTYTLLLGLGMRESSGNLDTGWDTSAKTHTESGAEAGLFQVSFNSTGTSPALNALYSEYRTGKSDCRLEAFKPGTISSHQSVIGNGDGSRFQAFTKACPAFATEYAATLIRVLKNHFGPLVRKEAEFRPECQEMFADIAAKVSCK